MNQVSFTVMAAADGGLVVYASTPEQDEGMAFAGNQHEMCEYLSKRVAQINGVVAEEQTTKPVLQYRKRNLRDALLSDQLADA